MKLHQARAEGLNQITGYGNDHVAVNGMRFERSLIVTAESIFEDWIVPSFEDLAAAHLQQVAALQPEVVLLGTGSRTRFPRPPVLRPLIDARVGYEIMDTGAACRTFGVLVGEGRRVLAALILDEAR